MRSLEQSTYFMRRKRRALCAVLSPSICFLALFIEQTILTHSRSICSSSFSDSLILEVRWGSCSYVRGGLGLLCSIGRCRWWRRLLVRWASLGRAVSLASAASSTTARTWMLLVRGGRAGLIVWAAASTLSLVARSLPACPRKMGWGRGTSWPKTTWRGWVLLLRRRLTISTIMASLSAAAHISATSRVARGGTARTWRRRFVQIRATTTMMGVPRFIVLTCASPFILIISFIGVFTISFPIPISPISCTWIVIVWRARRMVIIVSTIGTMSSCVISRRSSIASTLVSRRSYSITTGGSLCSSWAGISGPSMLIATTAAGGVRVTWPWSAVISTTRLIVSIVISATSVWTLTSTWPNTRFRCLSSQLRLWLRLLHIWSWWRISSLRCS